MLRSRDLGADALVVWPCADACGNKLDEDGWTPGSGTRSFGESTPPSPSEESPKNGWEDDGAPDDDCAVGMIARVEEELI